MKKRLRKAVIHPYKENDANNKKDSEIHMEIYGDFNEVLIHLIELLEKFDIESNGDFDRLG